MNIKYKLTDIEGYPDIIPHIDSVGEILNLGFNEATRYSFTLIFDNAKNMDIIKPYNSSNKKEIFEAIKTLRKEILREVVKPG